MKYAALNKVQITKIESKTLHACF